MKIELCVYVDEIHFTGGARVEVPDCFVMAFKPIKETDDRFMAYLSQGDEVFTGSYTTVSHLKLREDAVEFLSRHIANILVHEMKKNDTFNGYKLGESNGK